MDLVYSPKKLSVRQRDYLLLTAFVFARHGYTSKARLLLESLLALGEETEAVLLSRAVIMYLEKDYSGALEQLNRFEFSSQNEGVTAVKMVKGDIYRYLRARCYCETGRPSKGQALARALTVY